jgi:pectinesterase
MIKNLTDNDIANEMKAKSSSSNRKLKEERSDKWPAWLSVADRHLLQSSSVTPNVVVAADGSGDYTTVSSAVEAAPNKSSSRYVIRIKAGVYRENVDVPSAKTNIMFLGDGRTNTIITASRNVVDGDTTFNSATVGKSYKTYIVVGYLKSLLRVVIILCFNLFDIMWIRLPRTDEDIFSQLSMVSVDLG